MKLAWLTDVHLDYLDNRQIDKFLFMVSAIDVDALAISGDIADGNRCSNYLSDIANAFQKTIYFVLGNHDFYGSSFKAVKDSIDRLIEANSNLKWLSKLGITSLSEKTALIGHEGWSDGRLGSYESSDVILKDYLEIREFRPLGAEHLRAMRPKHERLIIMQRLAAQSATHFETYLPIALKSHENVIAITHVPPFREVCYYRGDIADDDFLPHYSSKVVGDTMKTIMKKYKDKKLSIFCGHTHSSCKVNISSNIEVISGSADYMEPRIQHIINVE